MSMAGASVRAYSSITQQPRPGETTMKRAAPYIVLFLFAMLVLNAFSWSDGMRLTFNDEQLDGPLGFLAATLLAGGGTLIAVLVTVLVAAVLAVVFAGVGVIVIGALALAALTVALAVSPLLLPLVLPLALVWYLMHRSRKERLARSVAL
jgi:hypothetical protein